MELSIQKAGLVLFYKNQLERYEPVILSKIKGDHELQVAIKESIEARDKLSSLNEEIEKDENVELIKSILDKQNDENSSQTDDPILLAFDFVSKALTKFMRI
jgi:hypothetical protein